MTDFVMTRKGEELLAMLCSECDLSASAAREFVEARTGITFDPGAEYWISYPKIAPERNWHQRAGPVVWRGREQNQLDESPSQRGRSDRSSSQAG